MTTLNIHGQENIVAPAFYMPNRLSVQACKTLHYLLQGRVCYLVDRTFPPSPAILELLSSKGVAMEYFDFRSDTARSVRDVIQAQMDMGRSVIFLPGLVSKIRGALSDVPAEILRLLGDLHLDVVPIFLGYYGHTINDLFHATEDVDNHTEEFCIMPRLSPDSRTAARILSAWLKKSEEIFSNRPLLSTSLTTHLVHAIRRYGSVEMTDGMTGKALPYYKILGVAMTVARRLRKRHERRIGVILPPGPGGTIVIIACLLAGITPAMINYSSSRSSFESTVQQAGLKTFITARAFVEKLPGFAWPEEEKMIYVEDFLKSLPKMRLLGNVLLARFAPAKMLCRMFKTDARSGEDEAVMLFTAGSTGEPKAVALTHRMIIANTTQCCCRVHLDHDHFLGSLPLFHSFGCTITLMLPLLKGRPVCTYPNPTDARSLCELIEKHRLSLLCATPTFARSMLRRAEAYTFASVHHFIVGAERLHQDLEKAFMTRCGVQLLEGYGLTEAAPVCSVNMPDAELVPGSSFRIPGTKSRSIGTLLPGIALRITDVDDDEKELPLTDHGMIWLKGANIFRGYVNRPEFNRSIFKDGWFKTGDIGSMDLNGFVTLDGRLSRFSKIGGEMVPHEGVEAIINDILKLNADDDVKITVTGVMDEQKGEALVMLSALPEHREPAAEREMLSLLRAEFSKRDIPNLWVPRYLLPVDSIPILPSGKQDLRTCKLMADEAFGR